MSANLVHIYRYKLNLLSAKEAENSSSVSPSFSFL